MSRIDLPYGRQTIDEDDIRAVERVLRSDYLTTGPEIDAFEEEIANACGASHAVAVSSGTAALHCAYASAGIGAEDEVITTPLTFCATANMILAIGARPVFCDVEPSALCLDPSLVEAAITERTRAIVPVDFAGHPADLDALLDIAARHDLLVIEDAAHAIGARRGGRAVGSISDLTTFSFHPVKTITTAEGGAIVTEDPDRARLAREFRNHGMVRQAEPWYPEVRALGFNYRLSALHAALGRSQLNKLDRFVSRRAEIVQRYRGAFSSSEELRFMSTDASSEPAWHLFVVRMHEDVRDAFIRGMHASGIGVQLHYTAVNTHPLYTKRGYDPDDTPVALQASRQLVSLPLFPKMTDGDVDRVIETTHRVLNEL